MKSWIRKLAIVCGIGSLVFAVTYVPASAQLDISPEAWQQIGELLQEKASRTPAQRKLASPLVYALKESLGQRLTASVDVLPSLGSLNTNPQGVMVDVSAAVTDDLLAAINQSGGTVISSSAPDGRLRARIPLEQMEALTVRADVRFVKPVPRPRNFRNGPARLPRNFHTLGTPAPLERLLHFLSPVATLTAAGSLTTQGDIAHAANLARKSYGVNGSLVRVGVLSDSAEYTPVLIAAGDLPADTTIVQDIIDGPGSSEGSAMMEIVYDLAPGSQLFFASAFNGPDSFADNIRTLRNVYHCDVIVDDVSYSDEPPFQDGVIAKAVNDVTANGAIYFSSAGNSGNLTNNNGSVWQGDFVDGGVAALVPGYRLHSFGPAIYNRIPTITPAIELFWSDALGASSNDYDLFVLNAAGTAVIGASTGEQSGTQDPFEEVFNPSGFPLNSRVMIAAFGGAAARALYLNNFFGEPFQIATSGVTRGHSASASAVSVAAVAWNSARLGTRPFVGGVKNPTEPFSSDGPRKIFYMPDGTPITPGNLLFGTNGGTTLVKPDIAAADGVTTRTPGFNPFFGTSAAAPHAAGIAALIRSKNPSLTPAGVKNAMTSTALDIRAVGIDRDSGYGLVMASGALAAVGP
jgi:subtilisin family serine protease